MKSNGHKPTPFKVTELWAFIGVAPDGDEGVMAMSAPLQQMGGQPTMIPMIGADKIRVDKLKPMAEFISKGTGTPYVLKHFKLVE